MIESGLDPLARAEADDRLRAALEGAGIVVWDVDLVTGHVVRSGSSGRIFGIESGSGEAFAALVHPDDRAHVNAALAAAYAGERPYATEFRITTPDGASRWVREHGEVHRDAAGTAIRLCGVTIDISDSKQVEGARRESEVRFRTLANTMPDMIWIAAADGTITFASDRWREYCGFDPMQHAQSWPERVVHPADRERRIAAFADALRDGTGYEVEMRKRRHDGVYRWFLTRAAPVHGPDGKVAAWFGTTTDIDDRKRMEEALRNSEAQLKMAVEAGGVGAWQVESANGTAVISDRVAAMLGLPPEQTELAADVWQKFIHPEDRARVLATLDEAAAGRSGFSLELRVVKPNGDTRWLMSMGAAHADTAYGASPGAPGAPVRLAGVALDITERKMTEERQGLLMAELDHRVRNILATIQAMISLTGRTAATPGEYAAALRGRIAAMAAAHSLLTRSQWDGADMAAIVQHETEAYAEGVVVRGPSGCLLRAKHALDFALALHELATNASKYGALSVPGGSVTIEWQVERDAGARWRNRPAAPLGEAHAHFVWRESGGPPVAKPTAAGFGSRLIERALPEAKLVYHRDGVYCEAWLPVREMSGGAEAQAPPAAARAADAMLPLLAGRRVLLVEDEPLVALELKTALEAAGAEIWTAASLQAAVIRADAPVSAAVLDVNLGDGMVYPVARQLLARGLPILFATGYEAAGVIPADLGEVPVLQKPVDSGKLVRMLAGLLGDAE